MQAQKCKPKTIPAGKWRFWVNFRLIIDVHSLKQRENVPGRIPQPCRKNYERDRSVPILSNLRQTIPVWATFMQAGVNQIGMAIWVSYLYSRRRKVPGIYVCDGGPTRKKEQSRAHLYALVQFRWCPTSLCDPMSPRQCGVRRPQRWQRRL